VNRPQMSWNKGPDPYYQNDQASDAEDVEVYESFSYVMEALQRTRRVKGTQTLPGLSCKDIKEHNPDMKNGEYWVDPNGGSANDAILVSCRFETDETCIKPAPAKFEPVTFTKTKEASFFMEDITMGKEFNYKVDNSQLRYLNLFSNGARQTIKYNCLNSEAYGVRLQLWDGEEFDTADGKFKKTTTVSIDDHCNKDNQWHAATFDVRTNRTETLPITDVLLFDVGAQNQKFGIELGEVCFS